MLTLWQKKKFAQHENKVSNVWAQWQEQQEYISLLRPKDLKLVLSPQLFVPIYREEWLYVLPADSSIVLGGK
jgi:hypothetical protein